MRLPPTQNDSQPDEMYLSTVEEESGGESMLMGGSAGAEDETDVSRDKWYLGASSQCHYQK